MLHNYEVFCTQSDGMDKGWGMLVPVALFLPLCAQGFYIVYVFNYQR